MAILSFLGRVFIAFRVLDEGKYPNPRLYNVQAYPESTSAGGVVDEKDLDIIRCTFTVENATGQQTVAVSTSTGWEYDDPPVLVGDKVVEGKALPMPPGSEILGPNQAWKAVIDREPHAMYTRLMLGWREGDEEPKYHFTLVDEAVVSVGCISGKSGDPA